MATRAETQERNRQALIAATLELVANAGYRAATVEAIAARAGLTTGAVYSAFGGKREMFYAAITHGRGALDLETDLDLPPDRPATEVLRSFGAAMARTASSAKVRRVYLFELELAALVLHDPLLAQRLRADGDPLVETLAAALTSRTHPDGSALPEGAAKRIAAAAVAAARGLVQHDLLRGDAIDDGLVIESCVALATLPLAT
ncbi:helix-turn-helix domain-containing protein [Saccharopolyspora sp. NPDC050389]|uniref:TetR/AcrR family transcriptional regulator n=1 Tax=Saccharopolyspora sp. NPDC050389 TaxID=3155516 RepID=UPI0033E21DBC